MALYLDVSTDDLVRIDNTIISLERKSGKRARIRIEGPAEVELMRAVTVEAKKDNAAPVSGAGA